MQNSIRQTRPDKNPGLAAVLSAVIKVVPNVKTKNQQK